MICMGRGIGKPRVKDDQLGAAGLAIDYALRVRVEVMPGLEMCADQQNDSRVCMIGAWAIESHPQLITLARSRRADVGVRVVTVHAPRRENSFRKSVFARTSDVIHDLFTAIFDDRSTNSSSDVIEHFVPTDALPFSFAALSRALQRIKNAIGKA